MSSLPPAPPVADALEQRDPWRSAWQALSNDLLLAVLSLAVILALLAGYILPQTPASGTSDPLTYSQWQTQARAAAGVFYDAASTLGLFGVAQAFWLRIVIALLAAVVVLRLADRVARLAQATRQQANGALREEERMRVTDHAPATGDIANRLRSRRYRVVTSPGAAGSSWLAADRSPWAEVFSILLHTGLLITLAGILLNGALGWDVARQMIDTETSTPLQRGNLGLKLESVNDNQSGVTLSLQDENQTVTLSTGQAVQLNWVRQLPVPCCLTLRLGDITPGFRVSALDAVGKPLTITASSYADPAREVMLTFRRDEQGRLVAVEQARMALLLSEDQGGRVQVYGVPSGDVLTDTLIRPAIVISGTTLQFKPATSAVLAAQYRPGDAPLWVGGVLALLGWMAAVLWPMQRLVVRHHGHWTEFYASGRGVRQVVRELISAKNQ